MLFYTSVSSTSINEKAIFGHSYPVKVEINKSKKRLTAYHFYEFSIYHFAF